MEDAYFIPIPISLFEKRWRGYNPSGEISKVLSTYFNIPIDNNILIKQKDVLSIKNPEGIIGRKILLLDILYNKNSPLKKAGELFKKNGAKEVIGITVSRK